MGGQWTVGKSLLKEAAVDTYSLEFLEVPGMVLPRVDARVFLACDLQRWRGGGETRSFFARIRISPVDMILIPVEDDERGLTFPIRSSMLSTILLLSTSEVCVILAGWRCLLVTLVLTAVCFWVEWVVGVEMYGENGMWSRGDEGSLSEY